MERNGKRMEEAGEERIQDRRERKTGETSGGKMEKESLDEKEDR